MKVSTECFRKEILGENLKILRLRAKISRKDLAWILGWSDTSITNMEKGKIDIRSTILMLLLKNLKYEGDIRDLYKRVLE